MGGDRASMRLHQRDIDLIHGVKGVNPNTVVSIIGSSAILIDEWEKDVPAIIFSFYSGMEGGNVLADILFGDVCPSGKLPYTVALSEDSYPDFDPDCTYAEYESLSWTTARWIKKTFLFCIRLAMVYPIQHLTSASRQLKYLIKQQRFLLM